MLNSKTNMRIFPLSNEKIDAKKEYFNADILHRGIKENKSTIKKSPKERLKVAIQNRVRNVTMDGSNKTALLHFLEMATWISLRPINTPMVDPQNELAGDMAL